MLQAVSVERPLALAGEVVEQEFISRSMVNNACVSARQILLGGPLVQAVKYNRRGETLSRMAWKEANMEGGQHGERVEQSDH